MPYYSEHFENSDQDWEPINWTKKNTDKEQETVQHTQPIPFSRQLITARQKAQITLHKLAQILGIKVKELEKYENGTDIPKNNVLARINKILGSKLLINK